MLQGALAYTSSLVASASERSSLVKYGLSTLEKNSYATATVEKLNSIAARLDDAVAQSLTKAKQTRTDLTNLTAADFSQDKIRTLIVDSQWFHQVESIVGVPNRLFTEASAAYQEARSKDYTEFVANLKTRLASQWNDRLLAPASAFYAACQEKYADQSGRIEYAELFADVRRNLGAQWESQVTAAQAASARVYQQAAEVFSRLRAQQADLQPQQLAAAVQQQLGSLWDERLREPLSVWLSGAQQAASADLQQLTAALDYDHDGQLTAADALHAGQDLVTFLRRQAFVAAHSSLNYLLPEQAAAATTPVEGQASNAQPATAASTEVVVSADAAAAELSLSSLYLVATSRVQSRVAPYVATLKAQTLAAATRLQPLVEKAVEHAPAPLQQPLRQLQQLQYGDVLAYANDVIAQGQTKASALLAQTPYAPAVETLQQALGRATTSLTALREHARAALAASQAPAAQAATVAQRFVSGVSLRELPASTVSFVAQTLGARPKDTHYETTVQNLRELLSALRQIVTVSAAAVVASASIATSSTATVTPVAAETPVATESATVAPAVADTEAVVAVAAASVGGQAVPQSVTAAVVVASAAAAASSSTSSTTDVDAEPSADASSPLNTSVTEPAVNEQ